MTQTNEKEMVNHPDHYNMGDPVYEPYRVIGEWGCNFNIGNAIKYLARYRQKWNPVEDLEKAKKYIDFEIERLMQSPEDKPAEKVAERRPYPINLCDFGDSEKKILSGDELQEKKNETPRGSNEWWDRICRGERIVDEANEALDNGASRVEVMKNILKMSDAEIAEVMKMNGLEDACRKIADKIAKSSDFNDARKRGRYFEANPF